MTEREFLTKVMEVANDGELVEYAETKIAKLDERNAKRANTPSKKAVENEPIKVAIVDFMADGVGRLASDIASAVNISKQKASTLCGQLVKDGKLDVKVVSVPKVGKRNEYVIHTA